MNEGDAEVDPSNKQQLLVGPQWRITHFHPRKLKNLQKLVACKLAKGKISPIEPKMLHRYFLSQLQYHRSKDEVLSAGFGERRLFMPSRSMDC